MVYSFFPSALLFLSSFGDLSLLAEEFYSIVAAFFSLLFASFSELAVALKTLSLSS